MNATARREHVLTLTDRAVDRIFVLLAGWLMAGVYLDAWAHVSRLPDSFWTVWHAILYSGLLACGVFLFVLRGTAYRVLLERGYELSLAGFAIAALGGALDAVWHTVFGVEFDIEAAVSPPHLLVAFGVFLLVTGPVRAARRTRSFGLSSALGLLYGLSMLTVILDYATPFSSLFGAGAAPAREVARLEQTVALFAFSAYAALIAGAATVALKSDAGAARWLGLVIGGNAAAMTLVNGPLHEGAVPLLLGVSVFAGVAVLAAAISIRPSADRPLAFRAFLVLLPLVVYVAYSAAITLGLGTWWSATFWNGLIALGGIVALLVSSVATLGPPQQPAR